MNKPVSVSTQCVELQSFLVGVGLFRALGVGGLSQGMLEPPQTGPFRQRGPSRTIPVARVLAAPVVLQWCVVQFVSNIDGEVTLSVSVSAARGDTLYSFEVAVAPPMLNSASPVLILHPQYFYPKASQN